MKIRFYLAASAATISICAMLVPAAYAQQTTSGIEGTVTAADGTSVSGATVRVEDTRTGTGKTIVTDANGLFRADGLVTGGPYTVEVTSGGFFGQKLENIVLNLQGNTQLTFSLDAGDEDQAAIVVTGQRANLTQLAIGPGQSFGTDAIESFPSISRDIRDIIRIDPRVSLDRANEVDRVSCLGGNDRANAFTVDGITQSDVFGLNGTPFASRNSLPIPFDAVRETSVEFAPFDVQYGQFTGCAINVVTKSGGNDFHGSAFFTFANDSLRGDKIKGTNFSGAPFKEYRWGATLSGPIIKDKLFFFGGYEETSLGDSQETGPAGQGFANELGFVTQTQFDQFSQTLQSVYGIDSGGIARSLPETNRRFFGRVDWYINDNHRLEATYQRLDEINTEEDDLSITARVFTGLNSFEQEGTQSNYYSGRLYSDWSDNFSTEVRFSRSEVQDVQGPVGGGEAQSANPIPRIVVGVTNNGLNGSLVAGPGFSRTSNDLKTTITQAKVLANLVQGSHTLTFGGELNQLKVFNLFAQNSTGTLTFNNLADFSNGILSGGTNTFPNFDQIVAGESAGAYGNFTASGNIGDAAARWKRTAFSIYAQDEWQATDKLNILGGVRLDWFSGDAPAANQNFFDRYGFTNANSFGKLDPVFLPRVGFTYNFENDGFIRSTQLKGGVGIFTGGDPTVYFSNAFSNNGFVTGFGASGTATCFPAGTRADVTTGGAFTGLPSCITSAGAAQSARGLADTQSTNPDFKTPTVLRANLGVSTRFGFGGGFFDDWRLNLDYIYSKFRNPINFVDLSQIVNPRLGVNGFTVDGRPIYRAIDPTAAGCTAALQGNGGTPPVYTNVNNACFTTSRDDEIQLTNGRSYESHVASVGLAKTFNGGLLTADGSVNFNLGYAYTDAKNNRYNTSATATSSYDIVATFDRQDPAVARSEFSSKHNITLGLNLKEVLFGDYETSFGFVFVARSGRPYSPTFARGGVFNDSASGNDNALLYVPTGLTDPNVVYQNFTAAGVTQTAAQAAAGFDSFINANPCIARFRGQSISRNACENNWFYDLDLRFSQEIPGPGRLFKAQDKLKLFVDFDNFLNLLDSGANVSRNRPYNTPIIEATNAPAGDGRYYLRNFNPADVPTIQTSSSLWKIQFGVSYSF